MSVFDTSNLPLWPEKRQGKASLTPEGVAGVRQYAGTVGRVVESRNWWRWLSVCLVVVIAVLGAANAWIATHKSPVETFMVVLDPDGRIQDVIRGSNFRADDRIVGQELVRFIRSVRFVSPDRTVMGKAIKEALARTTPRGAAMLKEVYARDPEGLPTTWPSEKARVVDDVTVDPVSTDTFTIGWLETVYQDDNPVSRQRFRGTIVVRRLSYDDDPTAFLANPVGAFVDTISWQATEK